MRKVKIRLKKRKRKTKVKFYKIEGLKCQGRKEVRFIKECVRYKRPLPTKAKRIATPTGFYTPDFEYADHYVEIKSLGTYKVLLGLEAYKGIGLPSTHQLEKIKWVAVNDKPVKIIVYLSPRETIPTNLLSSPNITLTFKGGYKKKTKLK